MIVVFVFFLFCVCLACLSFVLGLSYASQNNAQKSEGQKVNGNERANRNFLLIMNSHACVNELEQFVKQIDGVDRVKGDRNSVRLEVMGKVDPSKVKEIVERKTKVKVELIFPSAETKSERNDNEHTEAKSNKKKRTVHKNDTVNGETEQREAILKIKLCCHSCNKKLCENLKKTKGLDIVATDVYKDEVKVKGATDWTKLGSYIKTEFNKDAEIVILTEVKVPVKKGKDITEKKRNLDGDIEKDKDAAAINKRDKDTAVSEKNQDTGNANCKN